MTKELYINNQIVDLGEANPAITKQANDIAKPDTHQSDYTNQFKVPRTSYNDVILKFAASLNSTTDIAYIRNTVRYVVNGYEIVSNGYAYIDDSNDQYYFIRIYAGVRNFYNDLESKKLKDLKLNDCNSYWDFDEVVNNPNPNVIYPLLNNTEDYNIGPVVDFNKIFPALYVSKLMKEIAEQSGWQLILPDDDIFLSKYNKLFVPFVNDKILFSDDFLKNFQWKAVSTSNQPTSGLGTTVLFQDDNIAGYDTNNYYTTSLNQPQYSPSQLLNVRVKLKLDIQVTSGTCNITVRIGGVNKLVITETASVIKEYEIFGSLFATASGTGNMVVLIHQSSSGNVSTYDILAGSSIEVINGGGDYRMPWEAAINLPDISQKDFFKSICFLFGLIPVTNPNNNSIKLRLFKDIYENIPFAKNWTNKRLEDNRNQISNTVSGYGQINYYRWKQAGENEQVPLKYGDGEFKVSDKKIEEEKTIFTHPFSASANNKVGLNIPYIPVLDVDGNRQSCTPRLLSLTNFVGEITINGNGYSSWPSGEFEPLKYSNLYPIYYKDLYERMLKNPKSLKEYYKLDEVDVYNTDHFTPIYLEQFSEYFYVNKIENHIPGKETLVELIRL